MGINNQNNRRTPFNLLIQQPRENEHSKCRSISIWQLAFDQNLLVPGGTMVIDNAMMGGFAYLPDHDYAPGLGIKNMNEYLISRDDIFKVSLTSL